jgi:hypothetical protein
VPVPACCERKHIGGAGWSRMPSLAEVTRRNSFPRKQLLKFSNVAPYKQDYSLQS